MHAKGYTRIFVQKVRVFVRATRDLDDISAFDALYYDVGVRFIAVVVVVGLVVRWHACGGGVRHTASLTTACTHTKPETVVVVVVSPRI